MIVLMTSLFVVGYLAIALEHNIKINKSAPALLTGVALWVVYIVVEPNKHEVLTNLTEYLGETSNVLFFVLSAMTIVELIDAHEGFEIITKRVRPGSKAGLLWIIGTLTFFLSAILDNLTTTIVMITLLRKLVTDQKDRLLYTGIIVVAANAGGAWSPIGDVTTTMLWIGDRISTVNTIRSLILPSIVCLAVPLAIVSFRLRRNAPERPEPISGSAGGETERGTSAAEIVPQRRVSVHRSHQLLVFILGLGVFIMVPVFKLVTGLPPMMGILAGLGILWIVIEIIHVNRAEEEKRAFSVVQALRKIDTSSVLFFLGILLAVDALQSTGLLGHLARALDRAIGNQHLIASILGLASSIVDNVPLVAATMGMYSLQTYPIDNPLWELIAYAAGTGGSILIIGSAAGVAAMGLERISFGWYLKHISLWALIGYAAGIGVYLIVH
jgi:Na+/H+ antiporter NhaD/arsenite permease-like protein